MKAQKGSLLFVKTLTKEKDYLVFELSTDYTDFQGRNYDYEFLATNLRI
jgi:hypothetical protein